jgi:AraC-like DNA-binding protein
MCVPIWHGVAIVKLNSEKPRGVLNPAAGAAKFQLSRYTPAPDLGYFVERYWIVEWHLSDSAPHLQETLPYPCVNLVFQQGGSYIFGVISGKFSILLENDGRVFGIKFRPGAFYPFVNWAVSQFTDRVVVVEDVFGPDGQALEAALFAQADVEKMIQLFEEFLRARLPGRDQNVDLINQIVDQIIADRAITRVAEVASHFGVSSRTLQRLFDQYVGVSPKWVIQRYRLQEAANQLANGDGVNWAKMALDLGYFDQAHFIKDFKTLVGQTPGEYARQVGGAL